MKLLNLPATESFTLYSLSSEVVTPRLDVVPRPMLFTALMVKVYVVFGERFEMSNASVVGDALMVTREYDMR